MRQIELFVILPSHPFYGLKVEVLQEGKTNTQAWSLIRDPLRPGFNYRIPSRWLEHKAPDAIKLMNYQEKELALPFGQLQRLAKFIFHKFEVVASSSSSADVVGSHENNQHHNVNKINGTRYEEGCHRSMAKYPSETKDIAGFKACMGPDDSKQKEV